MKIYLTSSSDVLDFKYEEHKGELMTELDNLIEELQKLQQLLKQGQLY